MDRRKQAPRADGPLDDIQIELTKLIFSQLFPTMISGTVGLIFATTLMALRSHDPFLWILTGMEVVVCSLRLAVVFGFKKYANPGMSVASARNWERAYGVTSILYGCMMAAGTARVFWLHDPPEQVLCTIGSLAICAGLASRLGLRPWMLQLNGMIILSVLFASCVATGEALIQVGGVMVALYSFTFIESVQRNFAVVVEQLRSKRELVQLAQHDSLTGLLNQRQFRVRLSEACGKSTPFAVHFLDLDRFKSVNDTLGHGAGDDLLREVSKRLRVTVRETDLVARLGGDEFAILQSPITCAEDAAALAKRINHEISAPYQIIGHTTHIGVSVGLRLSLYGGTDADTLLSEADNALYRVKTECKGGFLLAADTINSSVSIKRKALFSVT